MNKNRIDAELINEIILLKNSGDIKKAFEKANKLSQESDNPFVHSSCAGILIDYGSYINDIKIIDDGIRIIEDILKENKSNDDKFLVILQYNLSNGYSSKAEIKIALNHQKEER